jgi:hypothetical protein
MATDPSCSVIVGITINFVVLAAVTVRVIEELVKKVRNRVFLSWLFYTVVTGNRRSGI